MLVCRCLLALLVLACASPAVAQPPVPVQQEPDTEDWSDMEEQPGRSGPGSIEVVAGTLVTLVALLGSVVVLLRHKLVLLADRWRQVRDHQGFLEIDQRLMRGATQIRWTTYLLAPSLGLLGVLIGAPYALLGVELALAAACLAGLVIVLGFFTDLVIRTGHKQIAAALQREHDR